MNLQPKPEQSASTGFRRYPYAAASDVEALAQLVADGRVTRDIGVTCQGRGDGAGAQATAVISAMLLARFAGCRYLHSPFRSVAHAAADPGDWARLWERFFNLGDGEVPVPEDAELVHLSAVVRDPAGYVGRNIVVADCGFQLRARKATPIQEALRNELRAKYWRSPKASVRLHHAPQGLTAAIHLRRGDVTATRNISRYVSDEALLRQIGRLRKVLAPLRRPVVVNLYSEGKTEDFRKFAEAGCALHISEDPFETFHNLVTADILITGRRTSFSQIAALLSQGIVLHNERTVVELSNYLCRRANGDISIKALRGALLSRMDPCERWMYRIRRHWRAD